MCSEYNPSRAFECDSSLVWIYTNGSSSASHRIFCESYNDMRIPNFNTALGYVLADNPYWAQF